MLFLSADYFMQLKCWRCISLQQRHYAVTKRFTTLMAAAMVLGSPLYRTFQVNKFGNRKYNFLLNYFVVLNVWHGFVFCKIPISIPLKIETSMHRYFARRYSVRCWYRVPVYSPTSYASKIVTLKSSLFQQLILLHKNHKGYSYLLSVPPTTVPTLGIENTSSTWCSACSCINSSCSFLLCSGGSTFRKRFSSSRLLPFTHDTWKIGVMLKYRNKHSNILTLFFIAWKAHEIQKAALRHIVHSYFYSVKSI